MPNQFTSPWTDEEVVFLRENWMEISDRELASILNRSFYGTKHKRAQLGLYRKRRYDVDTRKRACQLYLGGDSAPSISEEMGIPLRTVSSWIDQEGIARPLGEALKISPSAQAHVKKIHSTYTGSPEHIAQITEMANNQYGKRNPSWTGDKAGYWGQHRRAQKDFPVPLGICEMCGKQEAKHRMRIDHTLFPYHSDLIALSCPSCNFRHSYGSISITFCNPHDGRWYCIYYEVSINKRTYSFQ